MRSKQVKSDRRGWCGQIGKTIGRLGERKCCGEERVPPSGREQFVGMGMLLTLCVLLSGKDEDSVNKLQQSENEEHAGESER